MGYQYDTLIYNVRIASMQDNGLPYGELPPHAIAIAAGIIVLAFSLLYILPQPPGALALFIDICMRTACGSRLPDAALHGG